MCACVLRWWQLKGAHRERLEDERRKRELALARLAAARRLRASPLTRGNARNTSLESLHSWRDGGVETLRGTKGAPPPSRGTQCMQARRLEAPRAIPTQAAETRTSPGVVCTHAIHSARCSDVNGTVPSAGGVYQMATNGHGQQATAPTHGRRSNRASSCNASSGKVLRASTRAGIACAADSAATSVERRRKLDSSRRHAVERAVMRRTGKLPSPKHESHDGSPEAPRGRDNGMHGSWWMPWW